MDYLQRILATKYAPLLVSCVTTLFFFGLLLFNQSLISSEVYTFNVRHSLDLQNKEVVHLLVMVLITMGYFVGYRKVHALLQGKASANSKFTWLLMLAPPIVVGALGYFLTQNMLYIIISLLASIFILTVDFFEELDYQGRISYTLWWIFFQAFSLGLTIYLIDKTYSDKVYKSRLETYVYTITDKDKALVHDAYEKMASNTGFFSFLKNTNLELLNTDDLSSYFKRKFNSLESDYISFDNFTIINNGRILSGNIDKNANNSALVFDNSAHFDTNMVWKPINPLFTIRLKVDSLTSLYIDFKKIGFDKIKNNSYLLYHTNELIDSKDLLDINNILPKSFDPNKAIQGYTFYPKSIKGTEYKLVTFKKTEGYIGLISLFTLLFTLCGSVILLFTLISNISEGKYGINSENGNLRSRIQLTIIGLGIFSFIVIGIVTALYLERVTKQEANKTLVDQTLVVNRYVISLTEQLEDFESYNIYFTKNANRLSKTFNGDFVLYDTLGVAHTASLGSLNATGKLSPQVLSVMKAKAKGIVSQEFTYFKGSNEIIFPLSGNPSQAKGYIYFKPYFQSQDRGATVRAYLGTVLNVYIFLFLLSSAIAIGISNSITMPLAILRDSLRKFKLGSEHQKLEWSSNDEIGQLIKEYNLLTDEIVKSTQLIVKNERDMAWREMAKQVAHEIKNPLTPMKLSLQHLERAAQTDPANAPKLIARMSTTLMEQINNLTQIADSFTNFAALPKTVNEKIVLNEIVETVHDLFRKKDDIEFDMIEPMNDITVFADRNHVVRILNNIVKNAIQAIPEDKKGKVTIELTEQNSMGVVRITDNGTGISEAMKDKVFTPNFTTKSSGTGLGLAISANMLESMNGSIYFDSVEGEGTSFYVSLPIVKNENTLQSEGDVLLLDD